MLNEIQAAAVMICAFAGFGLFMLLGEIALAIDGFFYSRKLKRERSHA